MTFFGRESELTAIEGAIGAAGRGASAALVLVGEPGIGKSTLLAEARRRANGLRTLSAHGVQSEYDLAFGGLVELLAPLSPLLPKLPEVQRSALATALALEHGPPPDRLAIGVAVLGLLGAAADEGGLLVTVDDAQWLDPPSLEAILFATRRLDDDGVAVVIATRPTSALEGADAQLDRLDVAGLPPAAAAQLLAEAAGGEVGRSPGEELLASSAGNPLALIETQRLLTPGQLKGSEPLPRQIRPSAAIERSFRSRLGALGPEAERVLMVAAAAEDIDLEAFHAALVEQDLDAEPLTRAEAAEIITTEAGRVRFRHPVLRAVAYHGGTAKERREAHRSIAAALPAEDVGRRAWHLAEAAEGPSEDVAIALLEAADAARARGALASAGALVARASELTRDPDLRVQRTLDATTDLIRGGHHDEAGALGDSVAGVSTDPGLTAELAQLNGLLLVRAGRLALGRDLLVKAAEELAEASPAGAANALLEATLSSRILARYDDLGSLADRARDLALAASPPDLAAADLARAQRAIVGVANGDGERAADEIERHEDLLLSGSPRLAVELNVGPIHAAVWAERYDWAERVLGRMIEAARAQSPTELAYPLCVAAQLELRRGRFELARAHGDEAVRFAVETDQQMLRALALGTLADIDATLGRESACRAHLGQLLAVGSATGVDTTSVGHRALATLALVQGDPEAALGPLVQAHARDADRNVREPRIMQVAANLIETQAWLGQLDEARATLARLELAEREIGGAWTRGAAARGRGILGADEEVDANFGKSVAAFREGQAAFEEARSLLLWGERLRRARRRADSRAPLRLALQQLERLGSKPLAARARRELEATGESSRAPEAVLRGELTPQELRIGLRVAEGRTNPEVAGELFMSRKTVERHLSQVYRKLGVRSRTELARVLAPTLPEHPSTVELSPVSGPPA